MSDSKTPERITFKHLWRQVVAVLNFEKGLPFTIWQFLVHPRAASEAYLFGDRKKFMDPIKFMFLAVTIAAFITLKFTNTESMLSNGFEDFEQGDEMLKTFTAYMEKYYNVFLFANVLFYAFMTKILFTKKGWFYTEHLSINMYMYGAVTYFTPLILLVPYEYHMTYMMVFGILISIYFIWGYKKIFEEDWPIAIGKSLLVLIVASFLYSFLLFFIVGIIVGYQTALNNDMMVK